MMINKNSGVILLIASSLLTSCQPKVDEITSLPNQDVLKTYTQTDKQDEAKYLHQYVPKGFVLGFVGDLATITLPEGDNSQLNQDLKKVQMNVVFKVDDHLAIKVADNTLRRHDDPTIPIAMNPRFFTPDVKEFNTIMHFGWTPESEYTQIRIYYTYSYLPQPRPKDFQPFPMLKSDQTYTRTEFASYLYSNDEENSGFLLAVSPLDGEEDIPTIYNKNQFPLEFDWSESDPSFAGRVFFRNSRYDTSPSPDNLIRGFRIATLAPGASDISISEPTDRSPFKKLQFKTTDAFGISIIIAYNDLKDPDTIRIKYIP